MHKKNYPIVFYVCLYNKNVIIFFSLRAWTARSYLSNMTKMRERNRKRRPLSFSFSLVISLSRKRHRLLPLPSLPFLSTILLRLHSKTSSPRKILFEIYSTRNVYYSIQNKIFLGEEVLERSLRYDGAVHRLKHNRHRQQGITSRSIRESILYLQTR